MTLPIRSNLSSDQEFIRAERRDELRGLLAEHGIQSEIYVGRIRVFYRR
jgi:hypothetical protein